MRGRCDRYRDYGREGRLGSHLQVEGIRPWRCGELLATRLASVEVCTEAELIAIENEAALLS